MTKSTAADNLRKYDIGQGSEKVGEDGVLVGKNSERKFADAIFLWKEGNQHNPNPPAW